MKILLTGGTGFIGSHIAMKLVKAGHDVEIMARNIDKVPALKNIERLTFVQGDLSSNQLFDDMVKGKDACIHVALNYNDASATDMLLSDTLPSVKLADACVKAGVKHFIYTSSTAANDFTYLVDEARIAGASVYNVYEQTKQNPASYYGATKSATENYLNALSYETSMKVNIIRPGYTFGNPVVQGASIYADTRFKDIIKNAKRGETIEVVKNDGTQFIDAVDLAEIYLHALQNCPNRAMYFGLSKSYISWEQIATYIIKKCQSGSKLVVEDKNWGDPIMFDVAAIKRDFDLEFDGWPKLKAHIDFLVGEEV